jgi:hypothetical protein
MEKRKTLTFDVVAKFAKDYWGLTLYRCDPKNRGRWHGSWKTGFGLCGQFPGSGHGHRRFRSLVAAAKAMQMPGATDHAQAD